MNLFKEFKEFAVKGNMMDMAIGIIIGASFSKVINVLVKKILMPPLSLLSSGINLQDHRVVLKAAKVDATGVVVVKEIAIAYGELIEAFADFLLIGVSMFVVVKFMNRLRSRSQDSKDTSVSTPKDIELLTNLTELMQKQNELLKTKLGGV